MPATADISRTPAKRVCAERLAAVETTRRAWEAATSQALLAQIFAAQGDHSSAQRLFDPVLAGIGESDGISARPH